MSPCLSRLLPLARHARPSTLLHTNTSRFQRTIILGLHSAPKCSPVLRSLPHRPFSASSSRSSVELNKPPPPPPSKEVAKDEEAPLTVADSAKKNVGALRENIYTIPNLLTVSRIFACPVLGYAILHDQFYLSTSLLVYASLSDWVDGFLARRYNMSSVLGTILDPAADKTLMTTLTITLAMKGLLPVPLAAIILGRDVLLSLTAFYIRYTSLPEPKTFARYWDFSIPSAEVRPTQISKYNTALQLLLMLSTAVSPIVPLDMSLGLTSLQWVVATTTIWSGLSYVFSKNAVRIVSKVNQKPPTGPS